MLGVDLLFTLAIPLTVMSFGQVIAPQKTSNVYGESRTPPYLVLYFYSQVLIAVYCAYVHMTSKVQGAV